MARSIPSALQGKKVKGDKVSSGRGKRIVPATARKLRDSGAQDIDLNFMGSAEESAATRTVASRQRLHDKMSSDVEAFLARGGKINHVDAHITADPPKRPVSKYGQRPL